MDLNFKIDGLKELDELLKQFPEKVQRNAIRAAASAGAAVWRDEAKAKVPVRTDPPGPIRMGKSSRGTLPGFLKASVRIWKKRGTEGGPTVTYGVGTRGWAFYGKFLEFGTSKMSARPWLRPAVDSSTSRAIEAMRAKLAERIEKILRKR